MDQLVFRNIDIELEFLEEGISRKVLAHSDKQMIVEVNFESLAIGAVHKHVHEQIAYVISGEFEFQVEGEKIIISKGDSIYLKSNSNHGVTCLKKGTLLDVFTPTRKDFLE